MLAIRTSMLMRGVGVAPKGVAQGRSAGTEEYIGDRRRGGGKAAATRRRSRKAEKDERAAEAAQEGAANAEDLMQVAGGPVEMGRDARTMKVVKSRSAKVSLKGMNTMMAMKAKKTMNVEDTMRVMDVMIAVMTKENVGAETAMRVVKAMMAMKVKKSRTAGVAMKAVKFEATKDISKPMKDIVKAMKAIEWTMKAMKEATTKAVKALVKFSWVGWVRSWKGSRGRPFGC